MHRDFSWSYEREIETGKQCKAVPTLRKGAVSKWLKQAMRGSAFFRNIFGQAKTECRKNGTQGIIFIRNFQVE